MLTQTLDTTTPGLTPLQARMMNPLQLAYIGDTIHDLFVRTRLAVRGEAVGRMHKRAIVFVSAKGQRRMYEAISASLTQEEEEIARRGRNAHAKHAAPRNADPADYSYSTGLEALWGYLYLSGQNERLNALFQEGFARAFEQKDAQERE